jgi:hypothetical protein
MGKESSNWFYVKMSNAYAWKGTTVTGSVTKYLMLMPGKGQH